MPASTRCVGIVGPFQTGKTSLLEAMLHRTGAIERAGKGQARLGDGSAEARAHEMSTEPNLATAEFLGERFAFIDCPGSIEFGRDMRDALSVLDAAIVVCEPDEKKVPALSLVLRELEEARVPRLLFINKIDTAAQRLREMVAMLQPASRTPLLVRQIPIWQDGVAAGFIDLALECAFLYRPGSPSERTEIPASELEREKDSRFTMLERLADYDDELMESLISEVEPARERVFADITAENRAGQVVSVLFGSAEGGNGITRLLKALRHDAPRLAETRTRLGVAEDGPALAQVFKTQHTGFGGKLSVARVLRGSFAEGEVVTGSGGGTSRIAGLVSISGSKASRLARAEEGEVAGLAKLEGIATGESVAAEGRPEPLANPDTAEPTCALAIAVLDRKDDVRLSSALAKLIEEDPSLTLSYHPDLGETRLGGQGEMHLRVALERLERRFQVKVSSARPKISYRETIQAPASARGRHKKQTGGHGQFGDVVIDVRPLPRGEGFRFEDRITGGVVPRQYIGSVEAGAKDYLQRGPLGFPVVDLAVTLTDGSYHNVDSSDAAFQAAARLAMAEALPKAKPVLLEPVLQVEIATPTSATAKATTLVTGRRGQILGFEAREGWDGWDVVRALIPEAEIDGLIVELRSASAGVGTFTARFDHLAELTGRQAEQVRAAG
jgi:elongation factor G